jgi:hypothetical protein
MIFYLGKTVNEQTNNYLIIFIFSKCINNFYYKWNLNFLDMKRDSRL